ncbi:GHMP kinase [Mesorhizobium sp. WSM2239]|uniref:GHMP kinase n=1 Tax=Mesorhizobium sp. WSM2239 TaxID=3228852 RepID=A0AAU8DI23_9HYPH
MEQLLDAPTRPDRDTELASPAIMGRKERRLPSLVMTRTPLRVSFAGGGTDLPDFFNLDCGAVFSAAVDKYIYVTVKRHSEIFNEPIRLNYSQTEQVTTIDEIQNNIARECLRFMEIEPPIYISTVGDMPASTGMGGSSSFTVGLLNALHAFRGERVTPGQLADEACYIEMDILKEPIGKQDQYAAAFGGLNLFRFQPGGAVTVEPQRVRNGAVEHLFDKLMMFWTSHQRPASSVLVEQKAKTSSNLDTLRRMRDDAFLLQEVFSEAVIDIERFGAILHSGWELKRRLASRVSNEEINRHYDLAMQAGAEGGKLCGAGGGGFLMFAVKPERRERVKRALSHLAYVPIGYEVHGSHLLHSVQV